jgi:hypothetical protein
LLGQLLYHGNGIFTGVSFEAFPVWSLAGNSQHSDKPDANQCDVEVYLFGVTVATGDIDGDGIDEIITGPGPAPWNDSWIRVFKGDGTLYSEGFLAFPEQFRFGAKISTGKVQKK